MDTSSVSAAFPLPPTTTVTTTPDDVTITHHGDVTAAHHYVTTTFGNVTIAAATTTATACADVTMTPAPDDVTHNVSDEDSLAMGKGLPYYSLYICSYVCTCMYNSEQNKVNIM